MFPAKGLFVTLSQQNILKYIFLSEMQSRPPQWSKRGSDNGGGLSAVAPASSLDSVSVVSTSVSSYFDWYRAEGLAVLALVDLVRRLGFTRS